MTKIITVVGARPQFVKAAALSRVFQSISDIEEILVHTGQHFDSNMSDVFFEEMSIPQPKYNLHIHSLAHGAMTGKMMEELEKVFILEQPDFVLVYGDTNSTLAGALTAKKLHIKLIHVEAGLRSFDMGMPEEINRIVTDRISDILFCPTETAVNNLKQEGFNHFPAKVVLSGDVMEDAAIFYSATTKIKSKIINKLGLDENNYYLCTLHRAENTNDTSRLKEIVLGLNDLASRRKVVLPVHPRTKGIIAQFKLHPSIIVIEPVGYFDMIQLIQQCRLVLTDSGGLQKEAYFFDKFCVTVRDQTEWVELVKHGFNAIVGANRSKITQAVEHFENKRFHKQIALFGGGNAARNMAQFILEHSRS